jgi:hypothetical protein
VRRLRIIGSAVLATAAAIVAVLSLSGGAGSPLAEAGERIAGQSMRVHMDMDVPLDKGSTRVTGTGRLAADGSKAAMDVEYAKLAGLEHVPMRMIIIGDDYWFHFPAFRPLMPRGKRWVHSVDETTAPEALTPAEFAHFLSGADDVNVVDEDADVRGRPTTHYAGAIDPVEAAEEVGGETEARIKRLTGGRAARIPIEAWIGRDGLPARIRVDCSHDGKRFVMTFDILEYGVPVNVTPPPETATIEEREFGELSGP